MKVELCIVSTSIEEKYQSLIDKIESADIDFPCIPTKEMIIDLVAFRKCYNFTKDELSILCDCNNLFQIDEIIIHPKKLVLELSQAGFTEDIYSEKEQMFKSEEQRFIELLNNNKDIYSSYNKFKFSLDNAVNQFKEAGIDIDGYTILNNLLKPSGEINIENFMSLFGRTFQEHQNLLDFLDKHKISTRVSNILISILTSLTYHDRENIEIRHLQLLTLSRILRERGMGETSIKEVKKIYSLAGIELK